jgi:hypothetical protein
MPRSVPDDDMMDEQQSKDLGHATKSQPERARDAQEETEEERIEHDTRANRGIGRAFEPRPKSETEEAIRRAAYPSKR